MRWPGRIPFVGAYVCPSGVFVVEFRRARGGYVIERSFEAAADLRTPEEAAERLGHALRGAGLRRADVAVAIRGFGVVHHVLQMPPASDDVLDPVIEREMRRLEPQLIDALVRWISLPPLRAVALDTPNQRSVLAIATPRAVVAAFEQELGKTGFRLVHLTALPVGMQRVIEEFEPNLEGAGIIAPLPDGAFLGFALDGALRLVIEPHLPQDPEHELAALAEEAQLGVMLARQQFRSAQIHQLSLAGTKHSLRDAEDVLAERLGIRVGRYAIRNLTPAGYAALGAVLDARAINPLPLGGQREADHPSRAAAAVETASYAVVVAALVLAGATAVQAFRTRDAAIAAREVQGRLARDSIALKPLLEVAARRRAADDAQHAMRVAVSDRLELQRTLAEIAHAVRSPAQLDSVQLQRSTSGWLATLGGRVFAETNARAVQTLHELYREIPRRLSVDSVRLDQLAYRDSTEVGGASVQFQLSFEVAPPRKD